MDPRRSPTAGSGTPEPEIVASSSPLPTGTPATPRFAESLVVPPTVIPDTPEQRRAKQLVDGEPGLYGFVVLEADGRIAASLNGTLPFITASTYKLIVMADIYRQIEERVLDIDEPILLDEAMFDEAGDMYFAYGDQGNGFPLSEYLFAVGAYSSNAAARTLLTFTDPPTLRATAQALGMDDTYLFVTPGDLASWPPPLGVDSSVADLGAAKEYLETGLLDGVVNITTPLDMARYQLALANGTLISPWVSDQITAILKDQLIRDRLPFYLEGTPVINKPGNLDDAVNDVGVIYLGTGPRAVAMFAQAIPDTLRATLIEQRLALIATGAADIPPMPSVEEIDDMRDGVETWAD